jgi:hypothetical protein|tara:strand:+ start:108 stop:860 length:753 start_codon:yes stop_codon:yes gene_type:complete
MPRLGLISSLTGGAPPEAVYANNYSTVLAGDDDYVQIAHHSTINIGSNLTVSAWIKTDTKANQQTIISKGDSSSEDSWYVELLNISGKVRAGIQNDSDYILEHGTADLTDDAWHHVVVVINTDATLVYVDGSRQDGTNLTNGSETDSMTNTSTLYIGQRYHDGNGRYWTGLIDEVALWDVVLDADAITAIYNSGDPMDLTADSGNYDNSSDLISYWRFEEGSGTSTSDSSNNSNGGTLENGAAYSADVPS